MTCSLKVFLQAAVTIVAIQATLGGLASASTVVTQWTFEGDVISPATGSGTASLLGGTTATFATGNGGGRGWNTSTYPAQEAASGTAGVEFLVSTAGVTDPISVSFDHRASGTASRWARLDYTLDGGGSWVNGFWNNNGGLSPHDNFYPFSVDFSSVAAASNNTDFGFRIVSIFSPLAFNQNASLSYAADAAYMRANAQALYPPDAGIGTGNYGTSGTWRFDNVTVSAVPEPSTVALAAAGLGLAGVAAWRRRAAVSRLQ
jgi:hypothetical protein